MLRGWCDYSGRNSEAEHSCAAWPVAAHVGTGPRGWIDKNLNLSTDNREAAGDREIGTDRSLQIRQEIERIANSRTRKASTYRQSKNSSNERLKVVTQRIRLRLRRKKHRLWALPLPLPTIFDVGVEIIKRHHFRHFSICEEQIVKRLIPYLQLASTIFTEEF
jgi:hypothetical protein